MGDRRKLLGTGAVLVGMGTALVSGAAVAAADTGDADNSPQTGTGSPAGASAAQPSRTSSAASQRRGAPRPSAARNGDFAPAGPAAARSPRSASALSPRTPDASDNAGPTVTAPTVTVPGASLPAASAATAIGDGIARAQRATRSAVVSAVRSGVVETVASVSPVPAASAATPTQAPLTSALLTAMSAIGWGPGGDPVAGVAAPAAAVAPRVGSRTAAVVGTAAAVAAAPPDPMLPTIANGVTGVQIGHSQLAVPGGLFGSTVDADWYFPTQADGTVDAQGVIWLQHGFGATNTFYSALAQQLAQNTNSIVVAPTLSSFPLTLSGGCLICSSTQDAAAAAFLDPNRTALVNSAVAAGYTGNTSELLGKFALAGHSAGGGFATAVASDYVNSGTDAQDANLIGVVMYDGVSNGVIDGSFASQVAALDAANKPIYQIAAPAQSWNLFGATTNALAADRPGDFIGVVLQDGSHVDSMLGVNPLFDFVLQLVTKRVPDGNTTANYTLSTGWINDMYSGITPTSASALQQGLYAAANQQIVMGSALAYGLPSVIANQTGPIEGLVAAAFKAVGGLFGLTLPPPVDGGDNGLNPATPVVSVGNGATGVRVGAATLDIPCGDNTFYAAPATWYFPTQADGTVAANGVIWLQHGFLGFDPWYSDMAEALAQKTNSIVVAPSIFWFDTPLCPGCYLGGDKIREGASTMFSDGRVQLTNSARSTGLFDGTLPEQFVLTGHSAGGNFATAVGALITQTDQVDNFLGVVMFDGVSRDPQLTDQLTLLNAAGKPDYQIAAPPQRWNAYGIANNILENFFGADGQFYGLQIDNGSHTDVIGGTSLFANLASVASSLIVKPSPPGGKEAVRTLATGWINDIYNGNTTYLTPGVGSSPLQFGIYGPNGQNPRTQVFADQPLFMGQAGATTMPAPPAVVVDPNLPPTQNYLGTWYEQGSVRQFFSIGLVNTKAVYSLNPDGSIKVQNSGNYFGPNGPASNITGSAVPVTNSNNTRLNVGFFGSQPNADNPGNYWIIDRGTFDGNAIVGGNGYDWAIVSDPSGSSGFILTRPQTVTDAQYEALVARAQQLGVNGIILRTQQYPSASSAASRSVRI